MRRSALTRTQPNGDGIPEKTPLNVFSRIVSTYWGGLRAVKWEDQISVKPSTNNTRF